MGVAEKAYQRRWWILVVLNFSLLVIVLDNSILNVALPTLARPVSQGGLHAANSELQWMVDAYTLVFAGLLLTAGALGDRFGRKGAFQLGLLVFGAGSAASAFAGSPGQLIATRAVMGIGGALIMPATLSLITNIFTGAERGRAIAIWAGVAGIGVAIGPLTGGFLLEHFYWGSVFLVNVPIVVIGIIGAALLVPTSKDPTKPRLDPLGAALSIGGLVSLVYGLIEAPTDGWTDGKIVAAFGVAVVLLVLFAMWERVVSEPMLDVRFFKNARFSAASADLALLFFGFFGSIFLLTQYYQFVIGWTPLQSGARLLPMAVTFMIVAPLSARIVERVGTKTVVVTGLVLAAVGLALMGQLHADSGYDQIVWRLVVLATGAGLTMAPATESIMGSLPLAKAGVGSAMNDTTRQVGGALGVAVIGSVLSSTYGSKVGDAIAGKPIPHGVAESMKQSLGSTLEVAHQIGGPTGNAIIATAKTAFVDGMHGGLLVGAVAALVGALVALIWLPARAPVASEELELEYEHGDETTRGAEPGEQPVRVPASARLEPVYARLDGDPEGDER